MAKRKDPMRHFTPEEKAEIIRLRVIAQRETWARKTPEEKEAIRAKMREARNSIPKEKRIEIARMGGNAVVAQYGKQYMGQIGMVGGMKVSQDHAHMVELGKKGGSAVRSLTQEQKDAMAARARAGKASK